MATLTQGCISQICDMGVVVKQPVVQLIELKMVSSSDTSAPNHVKCARFTLGRAADAASARSATTSSAPSGFTAAFPKTGWSRSRTRQELSENVGADCDHPLAHI